MSNAIRGQSLSIDPQLLSHLRHVFKKNVETLFFLDDMKRRNTFQEDDDRAASFSSQHGVQAIIIII